MPQTLRAPCVDHIKSPSIPREPHLHTSLTIHSSQVHPAPVSLTPSAGRRQPGACCLEAVMGRNTVLVIDDARDLIELVRVNLEKSGFDVLAASDGRSGLAIAADHAP